MSLPSVEIKNNDPGGSSLPQPPVFQHVAYSTIDPFSTIKRLVRPSQITLWIKDLQRVSRLMGISKSIMIEKYAALMSDEPFSTYIEKYVDATNFASLKESLVDKITTAEKLQHKMTI